MTCTHKHFAAQVDVNRLEDIGRFQADIRITCSECGTPFRFLGLPVGLDLNGAAVEVDGTEARLSIAPVGETLPPLEGLVTGYAVRMKMGDNQA